MLGSFDIDNSLCLLSGFPLCFLNEQLSQWLVNNESVVYLWLQSVKKQLSMNVKHLQTRENTLQWSVFFFRRLIKLKECNYLYIFGF